MLQCYKDDSNLSIYIYIYIYYIYIYIYIQYIYILYIYIIYNIYIYIYIYIIYRKYGSFGRKFKRVYFQSEQTIAGIATTITQSFQLLS